VFPDRPQPTIMTGEIRRLTGSLRGIAPATRAIPLVSLWATLLGFASLSCMCPAYHSRLAKSRPLMEDSHVAPRRNIARDAMIDQDTSRALQANSPASTVANLKIAAWL
jgi:hypothetical protein